MAARRYKKTQFEVPIPSSANGAPSPSTSTTQQANTAIKVDSPPPFDSPFLPTPLETIFLTIYPGTLLLGSLFSYIQPSARNATYLPHSQSYKVDEAPSYFAKKSNVFNVYFVKFGWFWTTLAFFLFIFSHSSLGRPLRWELTKRRVQASIRYLCITVVWILVTQWCFGPPLIDRGFRWTGGQCELVEQHDAVEEMGHAREAVTHTACKAIGGQWRGGHDISGHVFLLILGSAMLWLELLPAVVRMPGLTSARRILTADGLVRSASIESSERQPANGADATKEQDFGVNAALVVAGLSWWMLLMTAAYFHTWFEKFTGLLVAFGAIYAVYFLPRAVPVWRQVVGMPAV